MTIPSEHAALLKSASKSFRTIKREMKTLKALLDALRGSKEPEEADDAAEAAPAPNGHHEGAMAVAEAPAPAPDMQ